MMKKIYASLAILMGSCLLPAAQAAQAAGVPAYRIVSPGGQESILIGTMHVPHAGLRSPAATVLDNAKVFITEHTTHDEPPEGLDPEALAGLLESRDVRALWARNLQDQDTQRIIQRYNCGAPQAITAATIEMLLKMRTARLLSMIAFVPCASPELRSRDDALARDAAARQIPSATLESQQEVSIRRASLPDRFYTASLAYALNTDLDQLYADLVDELNRGDFDAIAQRASADVGSETDQNLFRETMLIGRNQLWIPRLEPFLKEGRAVIAVGAGHLGGRFGLVELLRKRGYRVEAIELPLAR